MSISCICESNDANEYAGVDQSTFVSWRCINGSMGTLCLFVSEQRYPSSQCVFYIDLQYPF